MTSHARRSGTPRKHIINFRFAVISLFTTLLVDLKFPNSDLRNVGFISMPLTCKLCRKRTGNGERSLSTFPFDRVCLRE